VHPEDLEKRMMFTTRDVEERALSVRKERRGHSGVAIAEKDPEG
jgi:hypothetical protein